MAEKLAGNACSGLNPTAVGGVVGAAVGAGLDDNQDQFSGLVRGAIAGGAGGAAGGLVAGLSIMVGANRERSSGMVCCNRTLFRRRCGRCRGSHQQDKSRAEWRSGRWRDRRACSTYDSQQLQWQTSPWHWCARLVIQRWQFPLCNPASHLCCRLRNKHIF